MEGNTIYIAGAMTGKECFNFESFFYWARVWRNRGWNVINPAQIDCEKMLSGWVYSPDQYNEVLAHDLHLIETEADAIFMMIGWGDSNGATMEFNKAEELGILIKYEAREVAA